MQAHQPLQSFAPYDEEHVPPILSELDICLALKKLNPRKAPGPDGLPNWLLKEFAEVLAEPVCTILNSSFREQKFPSAWKLANITPLVKAKPVTDVSKHLRPISLTQLYQRSLRILSLLHISVLLYYRLLTQISLELFQGLLLPILSSQ